MDDEEYFGDPAKIGLMQRCAAVYELLRDDPRFGYYGRLVGLSGERENTFEIMAALARLQGAGVSYYFPKDGAARLFERARAGGFRTDRHEHFQGGEEALEASRQVLAGNRMPDDLSIIRLDASSPGKLVANVAGLLQSCDVMHVPGRFLRGLGRRGITLVAVDRAGDPVASASSFAHHHPQGERASDVFWGMLATRRDRRGQKIALQLGAMVIEHMWVNEGARGFITGVRQDNRSSQAVCNKLAIRDTGWIYAWIMDDAVLGDGSHTR